MSVGAMIVLNETTLAGMFAAILNLPQAYVVPKQGNWWNPQDSAALLMAVLPGSQRPQTWCAFALEDETPLDIAHYVQDGATPPNNWSVQHKIANLVLQFVGTNAMALASSIGQWTNNALAQAQFALVDGRVCASSGRVRATDFLQEGENTVKSYNVALRVIYAGEIPTGQDYLTGATLQGVIAGT
jgi:hypothetical protein